MLSMGRRWWSVHAQEGLGEPWGPQRFIALTCTLAVSGLACELGARASETTDLESIDEPDEIGESEDEISESEDDPSTERLDLGESPTNGDDDDADKPTGCNHIDFLFAIDNSDSMLDEQRNLAASAPGFIASIHSILELESVHLGVTTSEAYPHAAQGCQQLGGLVDQTVIGECGPYEDGYRFMTLADDLDDAFGCAAKLGNTGASDERPLESMVKALGSDLHADGACNEDFIRDDALLVVVLITDEEDDDEDGEGLWGSDGEPDDWFDAVIDAKGKMENVVALSLIGTSPPNNCPTWDGSSGAEVGTRIREFTEMFGAHGVIGDVCAEDYGGFFSDVMELIEQACDDFDPVE
ncbi:MAG: hypothetical protein V3V08_10080 [Nannocystaceae bacterium]